MMETLFLLDRRLTNKFLDMEKKVKSLTVMLQIGIDIRKTVHNVCFRTIIELWLDVSEDWNAFTL